MTDPQGVLQTIAERQAPNRATDFIQIRVVCGACDRRENGRGMHGSYAPEFGNALPDVR